MGCTLAMALAMGIDWRLSYLTPVLALSLLGSSAPRPTLKTFVSLVGIVAVAGAVGVTISAVFLPYPQVFLLLDGLMLFFLFYAGVRGVQPVVLSVLLIAITVIPVVALQAMPIAVAVAKGLVLGAAGAVSVAWLAHVLVPDPRRPPSEPNAGAPSPESGGASTKPVPSQQEALAAARLNTIVVFPVVYLYFVFGLTSVLVLVFIGLLSMQPDFAAGRKAGKALIIGNVMGGIAAVIAYDILVMVPQFGFLLLLTLLAGLFFGGRLFSGAPAAPLFGMAYSTMVLVIGSTTSMFGDADEKALTRVFQITTAVVYLVAAFGLIERLSKNREATHATG